MKKLFILLLLLCLLMSSTSLSFAADDIRVYVDNRLLQLEDRPIIQDGRTLVPMRAFFESLGATVDWEADTRTAVGTRGGVTVRIPIGSTRPTINNRIEPIQVPAQIIDGRTYIPLRFVGEALGDDVQWDGATRSITITRDQNGNVSKEPDHKKPAESLSVWVEANPELIPEGGGQTVTITATVADNDGYLVDGAKVSFHAEAFEAGGRNGQLSQSETTTDAFGQARVTYTTLAADDHRFVTVNVAASNEHVMEHRELKFIAANRAAKVSGVVKDPFTGAPLEDVHIHFMKRDINRSIGFTQTDADGNYSVTLPTGNYSLSFELKIRDAISVNISNHGGNYTANNNKGILKGVVTGVSPGNLVMAIPPGFNRNNPDNWTLQAEIKSDGSFMMALFPNTYELFIVGRSSPFRTGVTVQSGQVTDLGAVSASR